MASPKRLRVGVVGFGNLGQFLVKSIQESGDLELAFVWNRSIFTVKDKIDSHFVLEDLSNFHKFNCDVIVEVAHPTITRDYGPKFLQNADFMIGSPTALADPSLEKKLREAATAHGLYVPSGAFWGGEDIQKMADRGTLQALCVTMSKHPKSLKLQGDLCVKNAKVSGEEAVELYKGPVRELCPLAPNNVNTMAVAAMAGHNLGFDGVQCRLISDPKLLDRHIVEVEIWGPGDILSGNTFHCHTVRSNPAQIGNVTGSATYTSFFSSLTRAHGKGPGVHLC